MNNDSINEKHSLDIISNMIATARREHSAGAAYYYILWGIIVMLFSIATFCCIQFNKMDWQPYTYMFFLLGGILSMIHNKKDDKNEKKTASWFDDLYKYVWGAISVGLGMTWAFVGFVGFSNVIPISLLLYGMGAFITGGTIRFYPSLVGGIICFCCVIASFFVGLAFQSLICAFAVLCAHVVPGILMKKSDKLQAYA